MRVLTSKKKSSPFQLAHFKTHQYPLLFIQCLLKDMIFFRDNFIPLEKGMYYLLILSKKNISIAKNLVEGNCIYLIQITQTRNINRQLSKDFRCRLKTSLSRVISTYSVKERTITLECPFLLPPFFQCIEFMCCAI